ncbi:MAG: hypothetical protein PHI93_08300 [Kiritimatiellae bacterium]|jgi:predicted DNA-binding transcriptional regulator AlpA|nr:hypothetical protein [Kiritimatiellia bacterium]MDY0149030.1 hypothetical protein [Kiritimatiellia bacterium]
MNNENILSMSAFRQKTGASEATVCRWLKKGLPCLRIPRAGGGRAQVFFDPSDALSWVAANGNRTARHKAIALANTTPEAAPNGSPGTAAASKPSPADAGDDEGLLPALDRLRKQEIESHRLLIRLKRKGDLNAVLAVSERHLAETKALAVLENAAVQYETRMGELAPRAEMITAYERIMVSVKNSVLGIPSSVMPLIIPHLKDQNKAHDIMDLLDKATRGALRSAVQQGRAERAAREAGGTG